MAVAKRIFLFLALNMLVVLTLSVVTSVLGIRPYLTRSGIDYGMLMAFCLVWGMGGSIISLLISKFMAKWSMGVQVIEPTTQNPQERDVLNMVYQSARRAGLTTMPEVGIYDSPEVNAFATGPSRSNSLVAVSTGLLNQMDRSAVEGVIGHEVSHIANGDMVTMTLIQGVVNAFVMALARIVAFAISQAFRGNDERGSSFSPLINGILVFALEMVFMILGSIVVMWFSRQREFRADAGGAKVAGRDQMIGALKALQRIQNYNYQVAEETGSQQTQAAFSSMKISASKPGLMSLFRTHPTLEERIERLERGPFLAA